MYFNEVLKKYNSTGKPIYVMDDFNINLLNVDSCSYSKDFLVSLQSNCFLPTIDKPTRVYNNSATLIDNIFVNRTDHQIVSGNIISDICAHYTQFCTLQSTTAYSQEAKNQRLLSFHGTKFCF